MVTQKYDLEIITPMFLRGADKKTPELRPPSFKGLLRFWWRAIQRVPVKQLWEAEQNIFGSAAKDGEKSHFLLRIQPGNLSEGKYQPLPHHTRGWCDRSDSEKKCEFNHGHCVKQFSQNGFSPGSTFSLMVTRRPIEPGNFSLEALLDCVCILGGLGNRSRRGFGVINLEGRTFSDPSAVLDNLHTSLTELNNIFHRDSQIITSQDNHHPDYPWIQSIEIGRVYNSSESILKAIGLASHYHSNRYTGNLPNQKDRLASPLYVSVVRTKKGYHPVITTLNNPKIHSPQKFEEVVRSFREAILNG